MSEITLSALLPLTFACNWAEDEDERRWRRRRGGIPTRGTGSKQYPETAITPTKMSNKGRCARSAIGLKRWRWRRWSWRWSKFNSIHLTASNLLQSHTYIHPYIYFHTAPSIFEAKNSTQLIAGGQQMRLRRGERECHIHKLWTRIEACGQTIWPYGATGSNTLCVVCVWQAGRGVCQLLLRQLFEVCPNKWEASWPIGHLASCSDLVSKQKVYGYTI